MPNITDDPRYDKLFDKSMDLATTLCMAVMDAGQKLRSEEADKGVVHALNAGMAVIAGAIKPLAICLAGPTAENHPTEDHYLYAAVLTALCCHPSKDGKMLEFNYGPDSLSEAMDFIERATGRKLDGVLPPPLVAAAREMQTAGASPLKAFMDARAKPAASN